MRRTRPPTSTAAPTSMRPRRIDSKQVEFLVTLAVAQYRTGRYQDAADTLGKFDAKQNGEFPEAALVRARAEYRLGRRDVARKLLTAARTAFKGRNGSEESVKKVFEHFLEEADAVFAPSPPEKK